MSHNFIDRRLNGKNKSAVNRQRFLRRYKSQIKKAVSDAVNQRSIQDVDSGENVVIPSHDTKEYQFQQGSGGIRDMVHPGNDRFGPGDKIERPQQGQGGGAGEGSASDSGEGEDDFVFQISKDEYLDVLFEDLELPNLEENQLDKIIQMKTRRAGFTSDGVPANINILRSLEKSLARRIATGSGRKRRLHELEQERQELAESGYPDQLRLQELDEEISKLKKDIDRIPFIDTFDLRFNNFVNYPEPTSQAVMFCIMDVSGSMDQATKDMAKRFYVLLYLFLTRSYKAIDVVFIRHHTQAKEVDEHEFFYSQETGGTIVSSALKLMKEIINDRYSSSDWNIYAAQASDGDNWSDDSPQCRQLLEKDIMPHVRYFSYIEITNRAHQTLWREYEQLDQGWANFAMQHIRGIEDIYPVFRELFKKHAA